MAMTKRTEVDGKIVNQGRARAVAKVPKGSNGSPVGSPEKYTILKRTPISAILKEKSIVILKRSPEKSIVSKGSPEKSTILLKGSSEKSTTILKGSPEKSTINLKGSPEKSTIILKGSPPRSPPRSPQPEPSPRSSPGLAAGYYAGCKFTEPPSASALPLPPQHWMKSEQSVMLPFRSISLTRCVEQHHDIAQQLKLLLKVQA